MWVGLGSRDGHVEFLYAAAETIKVSLESRSTHNSLNVKAAKYLEGEDAVEGFY